MENKTLHAGDLTLEYGEGKLRYIKFGSTELIRGIYFAVRASDWGTLPLEFHQEQLEYQEEGFTISFQTTSAENSEPVVHWQCSIQGDRSNRITFTIHGTFAREYASNRTGFSVLHPLKHLLGQPFEVQSPHGLRYNGSFPEHIAPHQPATDISKLAWKTANGIECRLSFEGDLFEMEDQRNWTDASFKTYCTPLRKAWPQLYQKGDTVIQSVVFQLMSYNRKESIQFPDINSVSFGMDTHFPWPGIGSRIANGTLEDRNAEKIATLPLNMLRADIVWGASEWEIVLKSVIDYAQKCRKRLHMILHYVQGEVPTLVHRLQQNCPASVLAAISVVAKDRIVVDPGLIQVTHQLINKHFPEIKIGEGTQYLFTQFNRNRPLTSALANFVFFGNNAQVHAFDNQSIIETIEGQGETVKSARVIAPKSPIYVSPIALNAPFSPDKVLLDHTSRETHTYDFSPDSRQGSLFTAGWMLGCIAAMAGAGASHLDFFETEGERGLITNRKITPSFALLGKILNREPTRLFLSQSSNPLKFSCLGIHTKMGDYLYVANHTADRISIMPDDSWHESWRLNLKNNFTFSERMCDSELFDIPSFGIVEIRLKK